MTFDGEGEQNNKKIEIMAKLIKEEPFNTNNAWGFGGKIGVKKIYENGVIHESGKYCYRHTGASKFNNFYIDDGENLIAITKKQATKLINE